MRSTREKVLPRRNPLQSYIWFGFIAIAVGLPFHAFLITWLGSTLPNSVVTPLRYWKEVILLIMGGMTTYLLVRNKIMRQHLVADRFAWALGIFTLIHLIIYLIYQPAPFAGILALKINLGFLALYLILSLTQTHTRITEQTLTKVILIPAAIVGAFGTLQTFVLPHDFLTHFGYGTLNGPNPAYYLIENSNTIRVMSTLWGPNQFGSYLVLPLALSIWWLYTGTKKQRILASIVFSLDLLSLYGSQSRGAWLAAAAGILIIIVAMSRGTKRLILAGAGMLLITVIIILAANHKLPDKLNVLLLHGVPAESKNGFISSNGGHLRALTLGYDRLEEHPFGAGLEAAGRASENSSEKLYTENYFLQLAVQIGYEGLVVFIIACALVAWRLFSGFTNVPISLPLFASFVGLSINNIVAHTWSDGATAWLWWGMAGIVAAQTLSTRKEHRV